MTLAPHELKIYGLFDGSEFDTSDPPPPVHARAALKDLHKKRTLVRGELLKIEYFASMTLDPNTGSKVGSNLVAEETRVYTNGPFGPVRKDTSIKYILADDSDGPVVTLEPTFYDIEESRTAGRRRRRNVIDGMTIQVIGMLAITQTSGDIDAATAIGKSYLASIAGLVSLYIEGGDAMLANHITMDIVATWLDNVIAPPSTTIRHYILGELS